MAWWSRALVVAPRYCRVGHSSAAITPLFGRQLPVSTFLQSTSQRRWYAANSQKDNEDEEDEEDEDTEVEDLKDDDDDDDVDDNDDEDDDDDHDDDGNKDEDEEPDFDELFGKRKKPEVEYFQGKTEGENQSSSPEAERLFETIFGKRDSSTAPDESAPSDGSVRTSESQAIDLDQVFASIFGGVGKKSSTLEDLRYFRFYPKEVQKWVIDAKHPYGRFNIFGEWEEEEGSPLTSEVNMAIPVPTVPPKVIGKGRNIRERLMYPPDKRSLPEDVQGKFRYGITEEEARGIPPNVRNILTLEYGTNKEVYSERVKSIIEKFQRFQGDTGSPEVQIAILSERIKRQTHHKLTHHKDFNGHRGLQRSISRRKALMRYLGKKDPMKLMDIANELNIRV